MRKHQIKLFGSTMTYWEYSPNRSPVIVMVHGFRGTHDGLADIAAALPQYHLIVPDLPPFGESSPMTERAHDMHGYAELMWAFIDQLKLPSPPVLFGHSMGSLIVADMIKLRPDATPRAIMLSPLTSSQLRGYRAVKLAPVRLYFWLGAKGLPERLGTKLLKNRFLLHLASLAAVRTPDPNLRAQIHARHRVNYPKFNSRTSMQEAWHGFNANTVTEKAKQLKLPLLAVAGTLDDLSDTRSRHHFVSNLANGQLVEIPQVGHLIHYEAPAEVARLVAAFIDESLETAPKSAH